MPFFLLQLTKKKMCFFLCCRTSSTVLVQSRIRWPTTSTSYSQWLWITWSLAWERRWTVTARSATTGENIRTSGWISFNHRLSSELFWDFFFFLLSLHTPGAERHPSRSASGGVRDGEREQSEPRETALTLRQRVQETGLFCETPQSKYTVTSAWIAELTSVQSLFDAHRTTATLVRTWCGRLPVCWRWTPCFISPHVILTPTAGWAWLLPKKIHLYFKDFFIIQLVWCFFFPSSPTVCSGEQQQGR